MENPTRRADGGPIDGTDRVTDLAEELEALGPRLRDVTRQADTDDGVRLQDADAPDQASFASEDEYLQAAHAWAMEEFKAAAADLEHRTLELQQAVEVYPGLGADRPEAETNRALVGDDLAAVTGAVQRLALAWARLSRIETAHADQ